VRRTATAAVVLALVAGLTVEIAAQGRGGRGGGGRGGRGGGEIPPLLMQTDAFEDGGIIPERYAGRGGNVRPGFTFSNIPAGTVSFAMVLRDLDVAVDGATGADFSKAAYRCWQHARAEADQAAVSRLHARADPDPAGEDAEAPRRDR
jgi:hypothetical protein